MSSNNFANQKFSHEKLAKAIIAKRVKDNLSLSGAGEQAGVTKITVLRAEQHKSITIDTLILLCNWMKVPVQNFF